MSSSSPAPTPKHGFLARMADTMFVHRRKVFLAWPVLVLAIAGGTQLKGTFTADYNTPGSGSAQAAERLGSKFDGRSGETVDVVWSDRAGAMRPAVAGRVDALLRSAQRLPGLRAGVTTRAAEVSPDGRTAIVRMPLDRPSGAVAGSTGEAMRELLAKARQSGVTIAADGAIDGLDEKPAGGIAEVVAALVLLITFGTAVAAGLPLLTALMGVAVAVLSSFALSRVVDTPDWAVQVAIMIGLGVGIDYALLILTRYRAALATGLTPRRANAEAMTTAGHSVLVAGTTVVIALLGLFIMRLSYLNGVALAASLAVLVVMAATMTLLPALIGVVGYRIDRLRIAGFARPTADPDRTLSARWARASTRRPVVATLSALVVLAVLTSPVTGMRFGFPDAGNNAKGNNTREAYDMVARGFGPGANGPLIAVATTDGSGGAAAVERLRASVKRVPGVTRVAPAQYNEARDTALIAITPRGGPSSSSTKQLVDTLRDGPLATAGIPVVLGGRTASTVDQADTTAARLPLFVAAVVLLAFAVLAAAFRAPLIALKASVMTVLSIGASYGVVAFVAEGGWAGQLVGIDSDVPVPPFIPVMMFAVLFGLSMDYEVFLMSRIKEERERLGDAGAAVTAGLARTSKVVMAAALIMVSVFGAFALSPVLILKLIGIGLATAILIDALLIRMVLVPGVMRLLGERAWWTPRWAQPRPRPVTQP